MLKWILTTVLAMVLLSALTDKLGRLGFGRLPGDFVMTIRGRRVQVPLGSTVLLSLLAMGISRLF